jgi:predicted dehydrogenase
MSSKIRVALLGYGHLGRWHAEKVAACPTAELKFIVEKFPQAQEKARTAHPNVAVVDDVKQVIGQIDAAIIVTPTSTHFELLELLLPKGIHLFCEKPMTSTLKEARTIQQLAKKNNTVVQIGHSERFHAVWEMQQDYVPFFQAPGTVRINRLGAFKGRATDVDVAQDLMIHDLDLMLWLFRERPTQVSSTGYKIRTDKWDHICSEFLFPSSRKVIITVGRNYVKEVRELEIVNSSGTLMIDLLNQEIILARGDAQSADQYVIKKNYPKRDHLLLEHQAFYNSIIEKWSAIVGIDDGLLAIEMVDAVLRGLEKGQTVTLG